MSRTYSAKKNKHQKYSKIDFQEYLFDINEPKENTHKYTHSSHDIELIEDVDQMKQGFRHLARSMRNQ